MRFAIFSNEGTGLSWWKRLQDEGNEVLVFIAGKGQKRVGEGIVPTTNNYAEWVVWGRGGVYFFDCSGQGDKAEALRRAGQRVVGGGKFCDRLEGERDWSSSLVKSIGMHLPKTYEFSTLSATRSFVRQHKEVFVFKSNRYLEASATYMAKDPEDMDKYLEYLQGRFGDRISNILQEKLPGFALSTARWWNGFEFTGPYEGTIEHKKFLAKDIGPATGCSFNMVWFYQNEPEVAKSLNFEKLTAIFQAHKAPPGLYDINALLCEKDGEAYFLEFTPRLGFDSEPTSQKGVKDLGKLLSSVASGGNIDELFDPSRVYCSVRLSVPPYPWEYVDDLPEKKSCLDTPVRGTDGLWSKHFIGYGLRADPKLGLVVADRIGLVGLSSGTGATPHEAFESAYAFIDNLRIPNLQYRPDAEACTEEDLKTIIKLGYDSYR